MTHQIRISRIERRSGHSVTHQSRVDRAVSDHDLDAGRFDGRLLRNREHVLAVLEELVEFLSVGNRRVNDGNAFGTQFQRSAGNDAGAGRVGGKSRA